MQHYHLKSSQSDRVAFDEMVRNAVEEAVNDLDEYYRTTDPETAANIQWDMCSPEYTEESRDYAEDMGLIYVEDLKEAEARLRAVVIELLSET